MAIRKGQSEALLKGQGRDEAWATRRPPGVYIPCRIVAPVVGLFTAWILVQEATFWLLCWKTSLRFALGLQSFWVFMSILMPCACVVGKGIIHFPFPPQARMLWVVLIAGGLTVGPVTAFIGGQAFASYASMDMQDLRVIRDVDPGVKTFALLSDLETADFLQFGHGFRIITSAASRQFSDEHQRYYCAAPIVPPEGEERTYVSFFAVTDADCCRYADFPCDGWASGGKSASVIRATDLQGKEFDYNTALGAAQEAVGHMEHSAMTAGALLVKISSVDPGEDGKRYFMIGVITTVVGLLSWPLPALFVYACGLQGTC